MIANCFLGYACREIISIKQNYFSTNYALMNNLNNINNISVASHGVSRSQLWVGSDGEILCVILNL